MLSKQPIGDMWSLPDNDPHSQHYGESLDFDFSYIHSEEMKSVVKDYIWHCWRVNNGALASRQWLNRSLQYFMVFAKAHNIYSFKELSGEKKGARAYTNGAWSDARHFGKGCFQVGTWIIKALRGALGEACRPAWFTGRIHRSGRRKEICTEDNFLVYCSG